MDQKQKHIAENEEVIYPTDRVGPSKKKKHSVGVQKLLKYFPSLVYDYIRTP
jgi:hypothetical protein